MVKWQYLLMPVVTVLLMMYAPLNVVSAEPDTVTVKAAGSNNKVILNSKELGASFRDRVEAPVQGEINQVGEYNKVEINSDRARSCTCTQKEPHDLNDLKASSDSNRIIMDKQVRQHIKITQSGRNNSVKINSR